MKTLEKLHLCNDGLSADAIGILRDIMNVNSHPKLHTLHFFNNMSGDDGAKNVSEILKKHKSIQDFRWASTRTGTIGGIELIKGICELNNIISLDLNDNTLGEEAGLLLGDTLSKRKGLIKLSLGDCGLGIEGIKSIINALNSHVETLEYLDLSYSEINIDILNSLCQVLKSCKHLKTLILSNNEFENLGIKLLNHLLQNYLNKIEILNLNNNELKSYFVRELADILYIFFFNI